MTPGARREGSYEYDAAPPITPFIRKCTAAACLGGVLFGYDLGVISGALPSLTSSLQLTDSQSETVVAFLFIGSVIGSFIGGYICDKIGQVCDGIFLVGSIVLALAPSYGMILFGRIVVGIAVAVSAISDVSYLTEIAPEHHRGALVSCNEASISLGFLLAYVSSYVVTVSVNYDQGWRIMFGLSGLIALLQFVLMAGLPESPIWLEENGKMSEAMEALARIQAGSGAEAVRNEDIDEEDSSSDFAHPVNEAVIGTGGNDFGPLPTDENHEEQENDGTEEVVVSKLKDASGTSIGIGTRLSLTHYWRHMAIASFLAVSQQICGHINILNFAPEIFNEVFGSATSSSLIATTIVLGILKFFLTTFVIFEVDRIGRRFLLLSGIFVITVSLLSLTLAYTLGSENESEFTLPQRTLAVAGCSGVVAGYALSYAPLTWLIVSEIFPSSIRGRALGMTTITTNAFAALVSYTFLTGQDVFGPAMPFAAVFATVAIPDTGSIVAGGNGEDVDQALGTMFLWRQRCCVPGWFFRRKGKRETSLSPFDNVEERQDIVPPP
eukprot:CAMPEP_0178524848 /NCGR_PEP_ID=MMETSP0696-20121128/29861_1 /TAXON_ID=265572 /ORGANISM="Extubocellulus spinifer, Strain CCMP396" /LENGTH=551 /DNA_ID=CAMNT_0020156209 /DNA_START=100 /DNA_END=1751 /DNA_ORIENTATION=+